MSDKSSRRWFRFSLRGAFVGLTLLCCWLAWETSVVRERRTTLRQLQNDRTYHVVTAEDWRATFRSEYPIKPKRVSAVRHWLGDEAVQEIWYSWYQGPSAAELARLKRVFPEADVSESPPPPCHPGCFPRGTLVETPSGKRPIETINQGDFVTTVERTGDVAVRAVQSVFVTDNQLWRIETDLGVLFTTQTQPLLVKLDKAVPAGELQPGTTLLRFHERGIRQATVLSARPTGHTAKVFNLILGNAETFITGGLLARSKPPESDPEAMTTEAMTPQVMTTRGEREP